jgi:hypothetical protein
MNNPDMGQSCFPRIFSFHSGCREVVDWWNSIEIRILFALKRKNNEPILTWITALYSEHQRNARISNEKLVLLTIVHRRFF